MANEQRLIDANKLSDKIGDMKHEITRNRGGYRYCNEEEKSEWDKLDFFDSLVCDAPTVDAVEVVRCKDCKLCLSDAHGLWCFRDYEYNLQPDDFCSHGERRDKDAVD